MSSPIDRREEILSRCMAIFEAVPGVVKTGRNVEDVSGRARPAIIMHDGSEDTGEVGNRPSGATKDFLILTPQIYFLLGDRAALVGSRVSEFRNALVNLVWTDSILRNLVGIGRNKESDIRYNGCGLDTTTGETREARLEVRFAFTYLLDVAELA